MKKKDHLFSVVNESIFLFRLFQKEKDEVIFNRSQFDTSSNGWCQRKARKDRENKKLHDSKLKFLEKTILLLFEMCSVTSARLMLNRRKKITV